MESSNENRIELYLLGKLSVEETIEFEKRLSSEPELAAEVEQTKSIIIAFEKRGERESLAAMQRIGSEQELRDIINNAERRIKSRSLNRRRIYLWSSAIAAAVATVVLLGVQPQYSTQELYNTYNTESQKIEITPSRGGDDHVELAQDIERWNLAMKQLRNGKRAEATVILDELIESQSELSDMATELKTKIEKRRWF